MQSELGRTRAAAQPHSYGFVVRVWLFALVVLGLVLSGCSSTAPRRAGAAPAEQSDQAEPGVENEQGAAQLWSAKCSQCHYPRDPGYFSDAQWEVIMLHMRVRANLTVKEHHAILEFLRSAN